MSFVYSQAAELDGKPLVGSHQCVVLVQIYAHAPLTKLWTEGKPVRGDPTLAIGTAVATFVKGRYPDRPHGNHAALYLGQNAAGVFVVDQWRGRGRPTIMKRLMPFKGKDRLGNFVDPSKQRRCLVGDRMKPLPILAGAIWSLAAGSATAGTVAACPVRAASLTAVTVFSGPPAERADLRPDASGRRGRIEYESFGSLDLNGTRGTWLECRYGASRIEQPLFATAKRCTARYAWRPDGAGKLISFTCTG